MRRPLGLRLQQIDEHTGAALAGRCRLPPGKPMKGKAMMKNGTGRFHSVLAAMENDLARQLKRREGIAIENTPDALDEVQVAGVREMETRSLERETRMLRDVRAALKRIKESVYGVCLRCEEEISLKRLNAVPWAPLCISCQELEDSSRERHVDSPAWMSTKAA
jgi:DnaK suppressor protein